MIRSVCLTALGVLGIATAPLAAVEADACAHGGLAVDMVVLVDESAPAAAEPVQEEHRLTVAGAAVVEGNSSLGHVGT